MKRGCFTWLVIVLVSFVGAENVMAEGVTIVTHGWNVAAGEPDWPAEFQNAIADQRLGGEQHFGKITVTGTIGNLVATCNPWTIGLGSSSNGEIVVRIDWSAVANHLTTGITAQEVASVIAPKILESQQGAPALAELPIHLIGHSRGGGMVCELARLLGLQGVEVAHLTPLDPHPLTGSDSQPLPPLGPVIDTPVAVYENVLFADSYWQDIDYPEGEYVVGAYSRLWNSMPGGYHNHPSSAYRDFADHLNVILAYYGTIDLRTPTSNGEADLTASERTSWFNAYETDGGVGGRRAGFIYSRIDGEADLESSDAPVGGGDQIRDGYHNQVSVLGNGARSALDWSAAGWPNVITLQVSLDGVPYGPGVTGVDAGAVLDVDFLYRDYDSDCTLTFFADGDRNPYNSNTIESYTPLNLSATGSSLTQAATIWDTATLDGGLVYLGTQISDGVKTRYVYAIPAFEVGTIFADGFETGDVSAWGEMP